jgi:putative chitinase
MGNAVGTDDGWTFRGRGAVQTTGREGYQRLAVLTGLDVVNDPALVNDPRYFLACGVADFILCGCLPFAQADDIAGVTKRLNGGTIGLDARRQWLTQWKAALQSAPIVLSTEAPKPDAPSIGDPPVQRSAPIPSLLSKFIAGIVAVFRRS